ncbi:DUF1398 domain-containing protein [Mucilaginibacter roseus]|uniref:DUF1398 domain-containing protein n=1 Tax=Mucilaginibacter roseus TaxID=1528868 RepID=A0ABS8U5L8_9SPHI|nr:DUF1398 family protein [Mucilaginibacter roseus]MCD8741597.1 DUF1398 domain-containing protein [Mucilaginibacter roseus]
MFTLQQMQAAHAQVKSGADFPLYIQTIKRLGLKRYVYSVIDGSTIYYGDNGYQVSASAIYEPKMINAEASPNELRQVITIHQQGQTDFNTFCEQAAAAGVKQWVIDTDHMLCIYEDLSGNDILAEPIPFIAY